MSEVAVVFFLQSEFGQIKFLDRICICFEVDLLAQATHFCKSSDQINLSSNKLGEELAACYIQLDIVNRD